MHPWRFARQHDTCINRCRRNFRLFDLPEACFPFPSLPFPSPGHTGWPYGKAATGPLRESRCGTAAAAHDRCGRDAAEGPLREARCRMAAITWPLREGRCWRAVVAGRCYIPAAGGEGPTSPRRRMPKIGGNRNWCFSTPSKQEIKHQEGHPQPRARGSSRMHMEGCTGSGGIGRPPPGHRCPPAGSGDFWGPPPGSGGIGRPIPGHSMSPARSWGIGRPPLPGRHRPPTGSENVWGPPAGHSMPPAGSGGIGRPLPGHSMPPAGSGGIWRPPPAGQLRPPTGIGGVWRPPPGHSMSSAGSGGIWSPLPDHRRPPAGIGCPSSGHGRPPYWAAGCGMQGSRLLGSRMQGRGMEGSGK